ncbi:MAG: hypothetical protein QMD08_04740 [Actinomycetota bacterium]|nr:hypothetical protein [Actinomycetota bacterium]
MTVIEFLIVIFSSSVVATLVSKIWDSVGKRREKEERRREELYGPLKLYFTIMRSIDNHIEGISKAGLKSVSQLEAHSDSERKEELMEEVFKSEQELKNELLEKWWMYLEKIKENLELKPHLIKEGHFDIVQKFFDAYIGREIVGKGQQRKIARWLRRELSENDEVFLNAVEELQRAILED